MEPQSKREFLVTIASKFKPSFKDKFQNLLDLYRIPSEARLSINTLTGLFHYLDVGDTLCLKLLSQNLRLSGFTRLSLYVDEYIYIPKIKTSNISKTMRILNTLREGLTNCNIEDLHFLLGKKTKYNTFEDYLLSLISNKKMGKIDVTYLINSLNLLSHNSLSEKLQKHFNTTKETMLPLSKEEKRRFDWVRIGKDIREEDFNYLCFLLRVPIAVLQSFKRPMDLLYYLDSQFIRLDELDNALKVIGKSYLFENLKYIGKEEVTISLSIPNKSCNIFEDIESCLTKENILQLSFLIGTKILTVDFREYLIKLIEFEKFCRFDVNYLIDTLDIIKREDLSKIISKIENSEDGQDDFIIRQNSEENERIRRIFSLLALSLTDDDAEKIAILQEVPLRLLETIAFPIQLIHYLYHKKGLKLQDIENTLKIINRNELLHCLHIN